MTDFPNYSAIDLLLTRQATLAAHVSNLHVEHEALAAHVSNLHVEHEALGVVIAAIRSADRGDSFAVAAYLTHGCDVQPKNETRPK